VDDEGDRGGPFLVRTERGDVRAQQVVLATHYPILDRSLFFARVHVTREYVVAARLEGPAPQGMFYAAESPSRSLRTTPLPDGGELLLVGGEGHATGRGATGDRFGTLERWMREHFRVGAETWRWSAQDPTAHDKLPFAGRMPMGGRGRMWVVTGLRKWGFANGTSAAHVVAEGVRGRPHDLAGLVDPRRLRPKAAAFSFARENASVGTRFVAGRLTSLRPKTADELAPGEGAICRVEGHKAAAYRDAQGVLHAVSPICTHMGCEVRFNADERSWDCPCHASRFDVDGEVLEGPATRPLAPLETEADVEGGRIAEPG
jgi:nitrite reductase/ring-hydroxylating ferredoxin subunit